MKCEKCGGEWIPPKGLSVSLTNCPFCGTPLLNTETAGGYTEMSAFLEYLVSLYGSELYKDIRKLNNLISDLYRGDERMKRAYRRAMLDDMLSLKVYELSLKPINERMAFYDKLTSNFAEANFYTQEFGKQIVDSFVKGLKLEVLPPISTEATEEDGEWIDEYGVKYSADRKKLIKGNENLTSYNIKEGTVVICDGAFSDYWNLKSITIPPSVTSIGKKAFHGCWNLKDITIPSSVTSIGNLAFMLCKALKNITIPSSITSIGDFAFMFCEALESITIPSSITSIGKKAFQGCLKLHLKIENNPYYYVKDDILYSKTTNTLLWCPKYIRKVIIPSSITSIGDSAFSGCNALESITIPSSVTSIGNGAFHNCSNLHLKVENNLCYYVEDDILYSKTTNTLLWCPEYIRKVIIPSSVTNIGDHAFARCRTLESIIIPSSVTSIGICAFIFCKALKSILIPKDSTGKFKKLLPSNLHQYLKETD